MSASSDLHRLYGDLVEAAPDAILVVAGDGRIVFANQRTEAMLGWSPEELVGASVESIVPARLREAHAADRERYTAAPRRREMGSGRELFAHTRDGRELPVEISLSPIPRDGELMVCCCVRDISARKRVEAQTRRVSSHLESAIESIQGAFALFDEDDRLVLCNSTYRELFAREVEGAVAGLPYVELLDRAIGGGVFAHDGEPAASFRERLLERHHRHDGPVDVVTRGGHSLRMIDRPTPEGGTVSEAWDLTQDVQREAELRRMPELAAAASAAKTEFLSSMSHELRTPLNAVLGFAQLLRRDKRNPLDDRQRKMLDHVLRGGEHLLRLIDEILDLSRIEAGAMPIMIEPVVLADVLVEVRSTLGLAASRSGMEILVAPLAERDVVVLADRRRLVQILGNYVSNAIKYGRPNGSVTLAAEPTPSGVRITVIDDGVGIAPEEHEHIFQPFQRAGQENGPIEGTGIGLTISKRLAELMQGSVGFTSELGRGSSFWVELPTPTAERAVPAQEVVDAPAGESLHEDRPIDVVYVEDNAASVALMRELVRDFARVELRNATTAEIGLELVRAKRPDLVLMDINLPGMSGFDAVRRLRAAPETRGLPVIALSAAALPRDRARAMAEGFTHYLTKPIDVAELTAVLERVIASVRNAGSDDRG